MKAHTLRYALLAAGAMLSVYPFLWMMATSLKPLRESSIPTFSLWPSGWQWSNYADVLNAAPFGRYFTNTAIVAATVTLAVTISATMAGYAFARLRFRGSGPLFALILATMMVPFEATLIPNFIVISRLDWYNTYWALIIPWCANAFSIFLMRQAFLSVPREYFDAARVDGCGHLRFLIEIAAPLVKPMIITVALFAFLGSYNALIWPLVVTGDEQRRVIQVGLTVFSGAEGVRVNLLMAASFIVIFPTVAIYFAAQRYFHEGSASLGLKG